MSARYPTGYPKALFPSTVDVIQGARDVYGTVQETGVMPVPARGIKRRSVETYVQNQKVLRDGIEFTVPGTGAAATLVVGMAVRVAGVAYEIVTVSTAEDVHGVAHFLHIVGTVKAGGAA